MDIDMGKGMDRDEKGTDMDRDMKWAQTWTRTRAQIMTVRNAAQENVMNARGDFVYFMLWLITQKYNNN